MARPKLLDLFSGAGGCGVGYHRAGFDVLGVDIKKQPRYPFQFVLADALEYLKEHGAEFDAIHASPPCQAYSCVTPTERKGKHPMLIDAVRELMEASGKVWAIENVGGARKTMRQPVLLCGSMFGLRTRRHRLFELSFAPWPLPPRCDHRLPPLLVTTAGANSRAAGNFKSTKNAIAAYGVDWMIGSELAQAIPPAYTEWVGRRMLQRLKGEQ